MLEMFIKPNEKGILIFNNANEDFLNVTIKYCIDDKM